MKKTGYGGNAPVLWQQGKIGQVIDYCLNDVYLTTLLYFKIMSQGYIINPKTNRKLKINLGDLTE